MSEWCVAGRHVAAFLQADSVWTTYSLHGMRAYRTGADGTVDWAAGWKSQCMDDGFALAKFSDGIWKSPVPLKSLHDRAKAPRSLHSLRRPRIFSFVLFC